MDNQGRVPLGEGEEKYFAIELKLQKCWGSENSNSIWWVISASMFRVHPCKTVFCFSHSTLISSPRIKSGNTQISTYQSSNVQQVTSWGPTLRFLLLEDHRETVTLESIQKIWMRCFFLCSLNPGERWTGGEWHRAQNGLDFPWQWHMALESHLEAEVSYDTVTELPSYVSHIAAIQNILIHKVFPCTALITRFNLTKPTN